MTMKRIAVIIMMVSACITMRAQTRYAPFRPLPNENQLRELLTNYGEIFEVWFDGANGGDGWYGGANDTRKIDGKTYYGWAETFRMIRELQPKAVIWNDGGDRGDLRWVGTEAGNVGETNWSLMPSKGDTPWHMLHYGVEIS